MKRPLTCVTVFLLFLGHSARCQDSVKQIIEKVFYKEEVRNLIFFDYKGEGESPFRRPDGKFAFIIPDTTFQKLYPDILYQLAMGWGIERTLHTRTFVKKDDGSILVNNDFLGDETMRLLIRIDKIEIEKSRAFLAFHTTSEFKHDDMNGRYVKIAARLKKTGKDWKIKSLKIAKEDCCDLIASQDDIMRERK